MSTRHTAVFGVEKKFWCTDWEVAYPLVEITYDYTPGRPAFTPRGEYGPIDPPDPPDVSFVGVKLVDGDGLSFEYEQLREMAEDWINDDGFEEACRYAEDNR